MSLGIFFKRDNFYGGEQIMEDRSLPDLKDHREQHAMILSLLHHVAAKVMSGDLILGRKIIRIFPEFFVRHMAAFDAALALAIMAVDEETQSGYVILNGYVGLFSEHQHGDAI